jgi:hypothetical protein
MLAITFETSITLLVLIDKLRIHAIIQDEEGNKTDSCFMCKYWRK